jgi:hypothetical protein
MKIVKNVSLRMGLFVCIGLSLLTGSTVKATLDVFDDVRIDGALSVGDDAWLKGLTDFGVLDDSGGLSSAASLEVTGDSEYLHINLSGYSSDVTFSWYSDIYGKMILNSDNSLTLNGEASDTPGIVLNPNGRSYFAHDLILDGVDSQMPYQTIVDDGSILNVGLADERYMPVGSLGRVRNG